MFFVSPFGLIELATGVPSAQYLQQLAAEREAHYINEARRMMDALDPNVIDLPPDAVREIRDVPQLTHANGRVCDAGGASLPFDDETEAQQGFDVAGYGRLHGIGDSDGGECD
jgi:hypothetical protein